MTSPLALLVYEAILPGGQLVNPLRELGYRVLILSRAAELSTIAEHELPMVILADLVSKETDTPSCIAALRDKPATAHIPVLAFAPIDEPALQNAARQAGATLVAVSDRIQEQLPALLSQVLETH